MSRDIHFGSVDDIISEYKNQNDMLYNRSTKHPDYVRILKNRAKEAGVDYSDVERLDVAEKCILGSVFEDTLSVFDADEADDMRDKVNIGLVNRGDPRAFIMEHDGFFPIFIHYGLITFLNQCTKYQIAANEPQYIVFCDRKPPKQINQSDINVFYCELIANYRYYQMPVGPLVLLDSEADVLRGDLLYVKELFLICHELSHYRLGHLTNPELNKQGQEYEADFFAFDLALQVIHGKRPWLTLKFVFLAVLNLFKDTQYLSGARELKTHPQPFNRAISIAHHFLGPEVTDTLRTSLLTGNEENLFSMLGHFPTYPS